jgi:hypothetical protein
MMYSDLSEQTRRLTIRFAIVAVFSVAMAWMESAAVVYLRTLVNRIEPYQSAPLPIINSFGATELVREGATLIMLLTVGWLAGTSWKSKLGYFMTAFGIWDIFYYLFLKIIAGWPHSLLDWDVLFLIPLPWWGPVLSPILISLILIAVGNLLTVGEAIPSIRAGRLGWTFHLCGIFLALYIFMAHSIEALGKGIGGVVEELPSYFHWPLFIVALSFMLMPLLEAGRRSRKGGQ